jgi:protein-tyrosine phosphatase
MKKLLMVCMGNICRSPMAQTVGQKLVNNAGLSQQFRFDSAGTHAHQSAQRPDPRAEAALTRRGYEMGRIRSRRVVPSDFQNFDLILAMDTDNLQELKRICPSDCLHKLKLLMEFADGQPQTEVPDPYYGNEQGFERVLDLCEAGCHGLVNHFSRV